MKIYYLLFFLVLIDGIRILESDLKEWEQVKQCLEKEKTTVPEGIKLLREIRIGNWLSVFKLTSHILKSGGGLVKCVTCVNKDHLTIRWDGLLKCLNNIRKHTTRIRKLIESIVNGKLPHATSYIGYVPITCSSYLKEK